MKVGGPIYRRTSPPIGVVHRQKRFFVAYNDVKARIIRIHSTVSTEGRPLYGGQIDFSRMQPVVTVLSQIVRILQTIHPL